MSTIRSLIPDSSSILSAAYSPSTRSLEIHFRNGARYRYFDVPLATYDEMVVAPSKGRYFHRAIRSTFAYERIAHR